MTTENQSKLPLSGEELDNIARLGVLNMDAVEWSALINQSRQAIELEKRLEESKQYYSDLMVNSVRQIRELHEVIQLAREALENLMDVQNGPPLITYEKAWNEAMNKSSEAISLINKYLEAKHE